MIPTILEAGEYVIEAVLKSTWNNAFFWLARLNYSEIFRVLAVLDRQDVQALQTNKKYGYDWVAASPKMPHVEHALNTVLSGKKPATVPPEPNALPFQAGPQQPSALEKGANDYLLNIVGQKQIPLLLTYDFTFTIPVEASHPPKLTEQDFTDAADELDVEIEVIKAVNEVEAGGVGYQDGHRPTLRYELHQFHPRTHGLYQPTHPWLS